MGDSAVGTEVGRASSGNPSLPPFGQRGLAAPSRDLLRGAGHPAVRGAARPLPGSSAGLLRSSPDSVHGPDARQDQGDDQDHSLQPHGCLPAPLRETLPLADRRGRGVPPGTPCPPLTEQPGRQANGGPDASQDARFGPFRGSFHLRPPSAFRKSETAARCWTVSAFSGPNAHRPECRSENAGETAPWCLARSGAALGRWEIRFPISERRENFSGHSGNGRVCPLTQAGAHPAISRKSQLSPAQERRHAGRQGAAFGWVKPSRGAATVSGRPTPAPPPDRRRIRSARAAPRGTRKDPPGIP